MNGRNRKEIEFRDFVQPTGLAIDFNSNQTVYFCDFRADRIGFFGWDGLNVRVLASSDALRKSHDQDLVVLIQHFLFRIIHFSYKN